MLDHIESPLFNCFYEGLNCYVLVSCQHGTVVCIALVLGMHEHRGIAWTGTDLVLCQWCIWYGTEMVYMVTDLFCWLAPWNMVIRICKLGLTEWFLMTQALASGITFRVGYPTSPIVSFALAKILNAKKNHSDISKSFPLNKQLYW